MRGCNGTVAWYTGADGVQRESSRSRETNTNARKDVILYRLGFVKRICECC